MALPPERVKEIADRAEARAGQPIKKGRPTDFTPEMAAYICGELSAGIPLRTICKAPGMPDRGTVFRWLSKNEDFRNQYARAREAQVDAMAEDILEIADEGNEEDTQRAKLRIDARKWLMSKIAPKKYGEKIAIGGDKDLDPIQTEEKAPRDLAKAVALVLGKGMKANGSAD